MNLNVDSDNFEISRELLIKVDTEGVIKFISKNCYRILGFMQNEILNTNIDKFLGYRFDELLSRESFEALVLKKMTTSYFLRLSLNLFLMMILK